MRVLVIGPTPPPYHGVATFLRCLLDAPPPGLELQALDTADRRDASNLGRWDPINVQLGFAHLAELGERCLRFRPDIVYLPISQNVPAFLRDALFIAQARLLGARVVVHLHGGYFRQLYGQSGRWFQEIVRATLSCVSGAIVLSAEFRPIFDGLLAPERVFVVENGCPDSGAWQLRSKRPPPPPGDGTVLFMSTLNTSKGIVKLVESMKPLAARRPRARLRVAGAWSEESARVQALDFIARENLAERIEFLGNVDGAAKRDFLASGDLFCLPTFYPYEGQPLVLLEALAAGLPVVSTRHAAIPATTPDGETGWLLDPGISAAELATALDAALGSTLLMGCAANARERYCARYTPAACHARLLEVFKEIRGEG